MKKDWFIILLVLFLWSPCLSLRGQELYPHILVKPSDKEIILNKIHHNAWAQAIFTRMLDKVTPYVVKHEKDPQWILSRYLMNWTPGKHYTQFYSDPSGTRIIKYEGNASYPTIMIPPSRMPPIDSGLYSYRMPSINQLVPYDTDSLMYLQTNAPDSVWKWVNPKNLVGSINGEINSLVLDAAIIYWLTGKKAYGTFAADILSQWARGAYYQKPIIGPCRTGFLHLQTLGDDHSVPMILAYDFLFPFMKEEGYQMKWYQKVFEKIAATMAFRGYWNNNWFAAETPALVFSALCLNNKEKRDYYLNFFLHKDTINGACGQLAIPSLAKKWLTPDGHWKETGWYHNYAVSNVLLSALAMEENGYPVFGKYPALFKASYVMLKYCFPNLKNPAFGDNVLRPSQDPECLEIGILMAKRYRKKQLLNQLLAAMHLLIQQNHYERQSMGYLGLLCFLPRLPRGDSLTYTWSRSTALEYARCYSQRNGMDSLHGLMYVVQGATYNHNHANGMSMELYGEGSVMGADPGSGLSYSAPLHVRYYAQWAAHNTVIADARSSSIPYFKGGGGAKQIGHIDLIAMEPKAGKEAVSPYCSFTDTHYKDIATGSGERRTMAIIRTSDTSGYYVDIYHSNNKKDNEYLYHNIGDTLQLFTMNRRILSTKPANFPFYKKPFDPPGLSVMKDFRIAQDSTLQAGVIARFRLQNNGKSTFMQVLMPGQRKRDYYTALAPATHTAPKPYYSMPTPVLICRQQGQAWSRPFIAIYEPFKGQQNYTVLNTSLAVPSLLSKCTVLRVNDINQHSQLIFESVDSTRSFSSKKWKFKGTFGVIDLFHQRLSYLYLGKGRMLSYEGISIKTDQPGAVSIDLTGKSWKINCNQPTHIFINKKVAKRVILNKLSSNQYIPIAITTKGMTFTVPAIHDASLQFIHLR